MGSLTDRPRVDPPAVWAGPECSFLTVGTWACDQLTLTGHDGRADDIDRIAWLGPRVVRYPVLWGRHRGTDAATDWSWAEHRLGLLDARGIQPLIGLLHHGFGPGDADPLARGWPEAFGRYAGSVAARAPEGASYLPVNEPLTTARFGGLYGWWPPYARDPETFAGLLLAECHAYLEAARAIRAVRPAARIVVNEDLGRTYASPRCRSIAARHNERRWLGFDLVTGRVDRSHPAWRALATTPGNRRILDLLRAEPEPPDVIGVDHYVTSDRYLDDHVDGFPAHVRAFEGDEAYADVELARVGGFALEGFERAIADAWDRYRRPVALTEVQLAGDPADQAHWWLEAWTAATEAAARGIPTLGVTAWSVFGAYDWGSILRDPRGTYEAGCFDVSADGPPRETPLAGVVRSTAVDSAPAAGSGVGWWRRDERVLYRPGVDPDLAASA